MESDSLFNEYYGIGISVLLKMPKAFDCLFNIIFLSQMIICQAKNLYFTVYTWDTRGGKHKVSSRAVINLPLLMQGNKSSFTYSNRLAVSLEPRGTLYIRVSVFERCYCSSNCRSDIAYRPRCFERNFRS